MAAADAQAPINAPTRTGACGLTSAEAARRLASEGPHLLPGSKPKSNFAIVREVVTEPMYF